MIRRGAFTRGILLFLGLLLAAALNGQFQLVELWVQTSGLGAASGPVDSSSGARGSASGRSRPSSVSRPAIRSMPAAATW